MFAVIKTGGKQYRVQEGDVLQIEKLEAEKSQKILFDTVLLIEDEEKTLIGTPFIQNAAVKAELIEIIKDNKVIIFKKKRRKQYRRKRGHRQELSQVRITEIIPDLRLATEKEITKPDEGVKKVPTKEIIEKKLKPKKISEEKLEVLEIKKAEKKDVKAKGQIRISKDESLKSKTSAQLKKQVKIKEKKDGS